MRIQRFKLFAAAAFVVALSLVMPAKASAQSKAALAPPSPIPPSVVQAVNTINAAYPGIVSGAAGIQQAQNTGDPAAVVSATAAAVSQATGAAAATPSPIAGYLGMAAIFAMLVSQIASLFEKNKSTQAQNKTSQSAHATAQAALATADNAHTTIQAMIKATPKTQA